MLNPSAARPARSSHRVRRARQGPTGRHASLGPRRGGEFQGPDRRRGLDGRREQALNSPAHVAR
eukprot:8559804-Pyramimonas_sp.AAC.1